MEIIVGLVVVVVIGLLWHTNRKNKLEEVVFTPEPTPAPYKVEVAPVVEAAPAPVVEAAPVVEVVAEKPAKAKKAPAKKPAAKPAAKKPAAKKPAAKAKKPAVKK